MPEQQTWKERAAELARRGKERARETAGLVAVQQATRVNAAMKP